MALSIEVSLRNAGMFSIYLVLIVSNELNGVKLAVSSGHKEASLKIDAREPKTALTSVTDIAERPSSYTEPRSSIVYTHLQQRRAMGTMPAREASPTVCLLQVMRHQPDTHWSGHANRHFLWIRVLPALYTVIIWYIECTYTGGGRWT